jgi:hypothetical protein
MITPTSQRRLLTIAAATITVAGLSFVFQGASTPSISGVSAGTDAFAAETASTSSNTARQKSDFAPEFAYGGSTFDAFVADSYRQPGAAQGGSATFYHWMNGAYGQSRHRVGPPPGVSANLSLSQALDAEKARLTSIHDPAMKTKAEEQVAAWAHKTVKKTVPHFSLVHGFEFYNLAQHGQRQCLAQSVLIAGMLQRTGIPAGVVMVWKSNKGQTSNNGHCVAVMNLTNGRHILVDASDKTPFPRQQGLFMAEGGRYQYVMPVYTGGSGPAEVVAYRNRGSGEQVPVGAVNTMDIAFLHSQFDYYRGERTAGGPFSKRTTPQGLSASVQHLQTAINECPQNPLAVYMLGRVYQKMGRTNLARTQFAMAHSQYNRAGYVPDGAADAYIRSNASTVQVSSAVTNSLP